MSWLVSSLQAWTPTDCQEICPCLSVSKEEISCNFQRRRTEAVSRGWIVKLIWVALHAIVICSLFIGDTDLTLAWKRTRFVYLTAYIFLAVTNAAFYVALCLANPGYLQKGVHELSISTMKHKSQCYSDDLDIAEKGIGGLAHVDLNMGRRLNSTVLKEKLKLNIIDRTVTMPSLPSHRSKPAFEDVEWLSAYQDHASTAPGEEISSSQILQLKSPFEGSEMMTKSSVKKSTVRTRGSSLGGADEFCSTFKASAAEKDRSCDDVTEPLLGDANNSGDCSLSGTGRAEDAKLDLERRPSKPVSPTCSRRHERQFSWWEGPNPGRWCEYCGAWQLLRSRHCHDCARCVKRFDHHCTWIGSCIGQDNHLLLWWYLLIQVTLLAWTLQINLGAFGLPVGLTLGRTAVLLYCLVITFVMTVFVAILLAYHTYLVMTAQTTLELMLGHANSSNGSTKVPYLKHLPIDARPFSQGVIKNILDFCCAKEGKTYQLPAALSARKSTS